jgi:mannitol-specific phosphotransferase system IIBC component
MFSVVFLNQSKKKKQKKTKRNTDKKQKNYQRHNSTKISNGQKARTKISTQFQNTIQKKSLKIDVKKWSKNDAYK